MGSRSFPARDGNGDGRPDHQDHCNKQRADPRPRHLFALLLLFADSDDPGATPSSASGSLAWLAEAWPTLFAASSRVERVMAEKKSTMMNAAASPVRPIRIRCALLPAW